MAGGITAAAIVREIAETAVATGGLVEIEADELGGGAFCLRPGCGSLRLMVRAQSILPSRLLSRGRFRPKGVATLEMTYMMTCTNRCSAAAGLAVLKNTKSFVYG